MMLLANVDGLKESTFAVFCFFVPDGRQLTKLTVWNPMNRSVKEELTQMGIQGLANEGGVGPNLSVPYDIAAVDVGELLMNQALFRSEVEKNYIETRSAIELAAANTRNKLKEKEKKNEGLEST